MPVSFFINISFTMCLVCHCFLGDIKIENLESRVDLGNKKKIFWCIATGQNERRYLRPMHLPFLADEEELDPPPSRFEGHNTNSRRSLQKVSQNGNDSLSASHSSHVTDADNMFGGDEEDDDFGAEDILQQGQYFPSGTDKDDAIDRIEKGNIPKKIIDSSGEGFQPFSTPGLEHRRDRLSARLQPDSEYSQYFVDTSQVAFDPSVAFYYRSSHWEREDFMVRIQPMFAFWFTCTLSIFCFVSR